MAELKIEIQAEWNTEPGECDKCDHCGDVIVSDKHCLYLFLNNTLSQSNPLFTACNACFDYGNDD